MSGKSENRIYLGLLLVVLTLAGYIVVDWASNKPEPIKPPPPAVKETDDGAIPAGPHGNRESLHGLDYGHVCMYNSR